MSGHEHPAADDAPVAVQRLDKWLWFARIVKSRTLAAQLVQDGKVRVNRAKVAKPAQTVRPEDVLTIVIRGNIQVLKVLAPGTRRGPPAEARQLYELLSATGGLGAGAAGRLGRTSPRHGPSQQARPAADRPAHGRRVTMRSQPPPERGLTLAPSRPTCGTRSRVEESLRDRGVGR